MSNEVTIEVGYYDQLKECQRKLTEIKEGRMKLYEIVPLVIKTNWTYGYRILTEEQASKLADSTVKKLTEKIDNVSQRNLDLEEKLSTVRFHRNVLQVLVVVVVVVLIVKMVIW